MPQIETSQHYSMFLLVIKNANNVLNLPSSITKVPCNLISTFLHQIRPSTSSLILMVKWIVLI